MQYRKVPQHEQQSHPQKPEVSEPHAADVHVGRQVALLRLKARMTQADLARRIAISVQQLQKYESARNRISASMLFEIANAFSVPVGRLFDGLPGIRSTDIDVEAPPSEHIAFAASVEGQRLNDGLLALPPRVRHRVSSFITALSDELSRTDERSSESALRLVPRSEERGS